MIEAARPRPPVVWMVLTCMWLAGKACGPALAAQLTVQVFGPAGEPVPIRYAELLLVAWGDAQRIKLPAVRNVLALDLSPAWLASRWSRMVDMESVSIHIQADGYTAILSEPFAWLGSGTLGGAVGVQETTVDFRQGSTLTLHAGESGELLVTLRTAGRRRLRFVDEEGLPAAGMKVKVSMFWSSSNHCGFLGGADPLFQGPTDEDGAAVVADGDFPYAVELETDGFILRDPPDPFFRKRFVAPLSSLPTTFVVHRFAKRPLSMRVTRQGRPVVQAILMTVLADCWCAACGGPLGATDQEGRIELQDFYPEQYQEFWLMYEGSQIWRSTSADLPIGEITVDAP